MRYEDSMKGVAAQIIKEQLRASKIKNNPEEFHWYDEYATLNFFRFICKNIGNLGNGEIEKMVTRLKSIDQKAVENHVNGAVCVYDCYHAALFHHSDYCTADVLRISGVGEWKRVAEILWYSDFASLCTGTNQYGDCGGFEQQRVQHDDCYLPVHEYHDCLIRSDQSFDPEGRCGEFPDFEIYSDRKDCTFIHVTDQ